MRDGRSAILIDGAGGLLEREHELGQLSRLLDDAAETSRGGLVVVEGPAGIGKTRILEAARQAAGERGMVVLASRASELDREFPFGVVRQLFEPVLRGADEQERARLLHGPAVHAAPLLSGGEPREATAPTDQSLTLFHALYWLAANLAEGAPLMLVIDDVHWADASSLRFLQFSVPRLRELPVLVALGIRLGEPGVRHESLDALATDALTHVLRPAPLSGEAVDALAEDALGAAPERQFSEACHVATGGNPLLLRELLRELREDGVAPTSESTELVRQLAPSTVARAVLLRLARLGEEASRLARAVAVLGDGTPLRRACALAELPEEEGEHLAQRLAQADILAPDRPLGFAHPILRAAVYGELEPGERALAHRRASELLVAEGVQVDAVAVHLLATEPREDPEVVRVLRQAAIWARAHGATSTAVACLQRALEEPPALAERPRLILELALAFLRSGDPKTASQHFEEGARTTDDARLRASFAWDHTLALQALGEHEEALRIRARAVDEVRDVDPELAYCLEASVLASARLQWSNLSWVRSRLDRYLTQPSLPAPAEQRMLVTQAAIDARAPDSSASADALADIADRAIASGHLIDGAIGPTTPFFSAAELLLLADRPARAKRALDELAEQAQRRGSAPAFAFACGWRCLLFARVGSLADAEADVHSCAELALPQGWFRLSPLVLGYAMEVLIERGQLNDAQQLLDRSGVASEIDEDNFLHHPVLHARARLQAARGDIAGARQDLRRLGRRAGRWNTYPAAVPGVLITPELAPEDPEAARAEADTMLREGEVWGTPRAVGMALRARALLAGGHERIELLEEAVSILEHTPARLELARALSDLGATLRVDNRRTAARAPLRQALDIADALGATSVADRARHELRAAGGRPRRPRTSGVESLTASERRIAMLAAEGRSNPEIAQALFVTKKTVEAHLGNAYRKLDIRSRAELQRVLQSEAA